MRGTALPDAGIPLEMTKARNPVIHRDEAAQAENVDGYRQSIGIRALRCP